MQAMDQKNTVPMVEKALNILEYIGASETAVELPELQENLGIKQSSCYRIATTLVRRGWLEKRSDNRYEIAAGISRAADKIRFRMERYNRLQPMMNRLADQIGFSAKFSVRDGDEFVNVCSAQCRSGFLNFSDPGFRSRLDELASVSAIFLSESSPEEQRRLLNDNQLAQLEAMQTFYREHGYSFIPGQHGKNAKYPFDTLSFPIRRKGGELLGVISFLSLPGGLENELDNIAAKIDRFEKSIVNYL